MQDFEQEVRFQVDTVTITGLGAGNNITAILPHNILNEEFEVPYDSNGFFTGRDAELSELGELLECGKVPNRQNSCVIHSMGGVGKSQLALGFAFLNRQKYHWVFWFSAEVETELAQQFADLGKRLSGLEHNKNGATLPEVQTQIQYVNIAKKHLEKTSKTYNYNKSHKDQAC